MDIKSKSMKIRKNLMKNKREIHKGKFQTAALVRLCLISTGYLTGEFTEPASLKNNSHIRLPYYKF